MLKVVLSLISLSLIFSLTGCQDVQPPPDQQGAANPGRRQILIGRIQILFENANFVRCVYRF